VLTWETADDATHSDPIVNVAAQKRNNLPKIRYICAASRDI